MPPFLLYINVIIIQALKFYLGVRVLSYKREEERESCNRYKLACKFMNRKSLTIDVYMSARYSHYEHASCLHPIEEVSIYTNSPSQEIRKEKGRGLSNTAACSTKLVGGNRGG